MSEIESVKPALTVILDDGDWIINSTGSIGKAMSAAVLPLAAAARKVTIISDGEMKVMKRTGSGAEPSGAARPARRMDVADVAVAAVGGFIAAGPDIQDQFAADLEAGVTGEVATGEVPLPPKATRRKPQIFQDQAAPPAPELAEAEMQRLLEEDQQAQADAARVQEDQRFQRQQAVQANAEPEPVEEPAAPRARKREPRQLATVGQNCGNCGGTGQSVRIDSTGSYIPDEQGHPLTGVCQVCGGEGHVMAWGRGRSTRVR